MNVTILFTILAAVPTLHVFEEEDDAQDQEEHRHDHAVVLVEPLHQR